MKKKILVLFIIGIISNGFGQDTLSKEETSTVNLLIKQALDSVYNVNLGTFYIRDENVTKHKSYTKIGDVDSIQNYNYEEFTSGKIKQKYISESIFKVKSISLEIKDFTINRMVVLLNDNSQFHSKVPISLINFENRKSDELENFNNEFILLGDVLNYTKNFSVRYYPTPFYVNLNENNKIDTIKKPGSLNSLINYNIYSDIGSVFGEEENAWLQFEADAKFPIINKNISNTPFYFLHDVAPFFKISQRNNEFYQLESDSLNLIENGDPITLNSFGSLKIIQRSWLNTGLDLNFLHYSPIQNHLEVKLNLFIETNVAKVKLIDETTSQIDIFNYGAKMIFHFSPMDNFGFKFSTSYSWMKFNEKKNVFDNPTTNLVKVSSFVYLTPFDDNNKKLFLRYNYFNNVDFTENDFFQIQIGYKSVLKYKGQK